jgi:hypothetical protein
MNGTGQTTPPSKIVQIVGGDDPLALCEDGSVWILNWHTRLWCPLSPAHVANRQQASAATDETQRKAWLWDQLWLAAERPDIRVAIDGDAQDLGWMLIAGEAQAAEELLDNLARERKP